MSVNFSFSYVRIFIVLFYCNFPVQCDIPAYCLSPLNITDCGATPTQVFSYYKPGSRCEIKTWRGCSTYNIFINEYECSAKCVFRVEKITTPTDCDQVMNIKDCGKEIPVFTHIGNGICIGAIWLGCLSPNVYGSKESCELACNPAWNDLDSNHLKNITGILDVIIKNETDLRIGDTTTVIDGITTIQIQGDSDEDLKPETVEDSISSSESEVERHPTSSFESGKDLASSVESAAVSSTSYECQD